MPDSRHDRQKPSQFDIDISTRGNAPRLGWRGNVYIWCGIALAAFLVLYFDLPIWWLLLLVLGGTIVILGAALAWWLIVRRGLFTWMRLALKPAKLMERGDAAGAEQAYRMALARARQFAENDHRRGIMVCELAMFAKLQGRQQESLVLYEESVGILARDLATEPFDYVVSLNNYGICFIHVRDFERAQSILERAVDLTLSARKNEGGKFVTMHLPQVQMLQFVMHMNLAFLFMEMHELAEAEARLREADVLASLLAKKLPAMWRDHYVAMCALWEFESGNFAQAEAEVLEARDPDYLARVRAKLHMVRQEFAEAERLLRVYQAREQKKGTLLRPDLLKPTLEFAEALFGQGKSADALTAFKEARAIVADFAIPMDANWGRTLAIWSPRVRSLGHGDLADELANEAARLATAPSRAITILDKFRVPPQAPG